MQSIGWKRVKVLFWLIISLVAIKETLMLLGEWIDLSDLNLPAYSSNDLGWWLVSCSVLLLGYIRWVYKTNRDKRKWIVFPVVAIVVLWGLGGIGWQIRRAAQERAMALRKRQFYAPTRCVTEMNGYYHCAQDVITPAGDEIGLRNCTYLEVAMASLGSTPFYARPVCWDNQSPPHLPVASGEKGQPPIGEWAQVKVYLPKLNHTTKLSSCNAGFRCITQSEWVTGPSFAYDKTVIKDENEIHQPMYIEQQYETFGEDQKATVQTFCKAGFDIFQDVPIGSVGTVGSAPDPQADRSKTVSVCVATSSPVSNSQTDDDQGMRWGMSKQEVAQIFSRDSGDLKLDEVGSDALVYRNNAASRSDYNWYYFKEGKLVETKQVQAEGYLPSWYDERLIEMMKKYGQPLPQKAPPNLEPIRSDVFSTERSLIILILSRDMELCGSLTKEDCSAVSVSEIFVDRSQVGLAVR